MRFIGAVPTFQLHHGFWSVLGTIGGAALAPFTGGASLAIGSALGQAADSAGAEKKAAKQQQQGYMQGVQAYQPFHTLGLQSANSLAHELGLEGIQMPAGVGAMGPPMLGIPGTIGQMRDRATERQAANRGGRTLADLWRSEQEPVMPRSLPSGSGKRTLSSYRSAT